MWETCDFQLGAFSPDGKYVVGLAPYFDGNGSPSVAMLDATTGEPVVDFVSGRTAGSAAQVADVVWEDATTLVATVTQGADQYVVRATIDGRVEVVGRSRPSDLGTEFWFPRAHVRLARQLRRPRPWAEPGRRRRRGTPPTRRPRR